MSRDLEKFCRHPNVTGAGYHDDKIYVFVGKELFIFDGINQGRYEGRQMRNLIEFDLDTKAKYGGINVGFEGSFILDRKLFSFDLNGMLKLFMV